MGNEAQEVSIAGSGIGNALQSILEADDIQPGDDPSYQACRALYLYHPLGKKLVDAPIELAQSKARETSIKDAPDEVKEAFDQKWEEMGAESLIFNEHHTARMYGIGSIVAVLDGKPASAAIDMATLWKNEDKLKFNVLDPLNTAGSLVLSQTPTDVDFQRPVTVAANGTVFHRSRWHVVMNEMPVYLAYTGAAFGFVGRSVFQRTLYPLKSFLQTMRMDDVVSNKNSMIIYKATAPSSIVSEVMQMIGVIKRKLIRFGRNGNVLTIGQDEEIETIKMDHVAQSGEFARNNILKNIASGGSMPAIMVNDETLVSGLADGTEDAKVIARFGEHFRLSMLPSYKFLDNYCMYLAWTPDFIKRMQADNKDLKGKTPEEIFATWRKNFRAKWPSLLQESEKERAEREQIKAGILIALLGEIMDRLDTENQLKFMMFLKDNLNESSLIEHEWELDPAALEEWLDEQEEQRALMPDAGQQSPQSGKQAGKSGKGGASNFLPALRALREV
jgi:Protein of unknown function (DUF1073)